MNRNLYKQKACAMLLSFCILASIFDIIPWFPATAVGEEEITVEEAIQHVEIIGIVGDDDVEHTDLGEIDTEYNIIDNDDSGELSDTDDANDDTGITGGNDVGNDDINNDDTSNDDISNDDISDDDINDDAVINESICEHCEKHPCECLRDDFPPCEDCADDVCLCDPDFCDDDVCICESDFCDEFSEDCEICVEEVECECIDFSMLRSNILVASNVNNFVTLDNIVRGAITDNQVANFAIDANAATINAAITGGMPVIVQVNANFTITSTIPVQKGHKITLVSQTGNRILSVSAPLADIRHFIVDEGAELMLHNIMLRGTGGAHPNVRFIRGGITVDGGLLTMGENAQILNNSYSGPGNINGGGGVTLFNGGKLIMNNGTIAGNRSSPENGSNRGGGGVYVGVGCEFIMNAGVVHNNLADINGTDNDFLTGGGGIYVKGKFTFNNGTISNNRSISSPGTQHGGGGILVGTGGKMTMNNGLITLNNGDRREARSIWQGGGGILTAGKVIMNNGRIHDNRTNWEGGGVFVAPNGVFKMYQGDITNNTATNSGHGGGGVLIMGGRFITANRSPDDPTRKFIANNRTQNNAGGISVRGRMGHHFNGPGELTIVDGTIITNNTAGGGGGAVDTGIGGAIMITDGATVNLHGGEIYSNIGARSRGIVWCDESTITLKGNPRVGSATDMDSVHRYLSNNNPNQVMIIEEPLGNRAHINVRELTTDLARPNTPDDDLTVIARRRNGNATYRDGQFFRYLGTGNPRSTWVVEPQSASNSPNLILTPPTYFELISVPDNLHFGKRPLFTTNLFGPYGDAPEASNVLSDYDRGERNWQYGFEVINTRYDNWTMTLQATPFTSNDDIVGAFPVAVRKDELNPIPIDLTLSPLIIHTDNTRGASIKWHWTELKYNIEAQTELEAVVADDFQSVFTWELLNVP